MQYKHKEWSIKKLFTEYEQKNLDLSPPYQRNSIWSLKAQRELIDTITQKQPIPNFFIFQDENGKYEMVDGQQRSRSIFSFLKGNIKNSKKQTIDDCSDFENYLLNITLITGLGELDRIEEFYALVNRTGLRLNKPELYTAQYYDKLFLKLVQRLSDHESFCKLNLFTSTSRMNDQDLVSELLALLHCGISDKKDKVKLLFEEDISEADAQKLEKGFLEIVSVLNDWDEIYPIKKTRYKQRNDLYTLFSIIQKYNNPNVLEAIYDWLLVFDDEIKPSTECTAFKDYTDHCISQSNSKKARETRLKIMEEILFPKLHSEITKSIMSFYDLDNTNIIDIGDQKMFDTSLIEE